MYRQQAIATKASRRSYQGKRSRRDARRAGKIRKESIMTKPRCRGRSCVAGMLAVKAAYSCITENRMHKAGTIQRQALVYCRTTDSLSYFSMIFAMSSGAATVVFRISSFMGEHPLRL